jgi:hypothetical protein
LFLVGDNAPVNKSLADLIGVQFIGCASHRFNLACKRFLQPYENELAKINDLMKTLSHIKQAGLCLTYIGKLRRETDLEPIRRNVTRWSSTHEMLKRFFQIKEFVDDVDPDLACNLPSGKQTLVLKKILEALGIFDNVTKQLQDPKCTLSEVRILFDAIIDAYPGMAYYLTPSSHIIHSKHFESGIVKIIDEQFDELSPEDYISHACI